MERSVWGMALAWYTTKVTREISRDGCVCTTISFSYYHFVLVLSQRETDA